MIAVIFATHFEARPFFLRAGVDEVPREGVKALSISGVRCEAWISRMGIENATRTTEKLLAQGRADVVINGGIAGALANGLSVGELFWIGEAGMADLPNFSCDIPKNINFSTARLFTSAEAVFDPIRRRELAGRAELVDMEGAAVAHVCRQAQVPCHLLKGVSDLADNKGKASIIKSIDAVSRQISDALCEVLSQI